MIGAVDSGFVYVTSVRSTVEKLWRALIEPQFTRQFWAATVEATRRWPEGL